MIMYISLKNIRSRQIIFTIMIGLLVFATLLAAPVRADPAPTLAARWDFNEGGGQIANDITGSNDGRLGSTTGNDGYDPIWVPGKDVDFGDALLFTNDYVRVEDSASLDITGPITLEAWIKPLSIPYETMIMSKWNTSSQRSYTIYIRDNHVWFLYSPNGLNWGGVYGTKEMDSYIGSWVHIAGTFDGTTQRIYINGVEDATKERDLGGFAGTAPLYIGSYSPNNRPFNGYIDEARIWGSALDASQLDDMTGPVVSNVVANPVAINTVPTVTFDVSDGTGTGVESVEYRVDGAGPWITWTPALPSYDEPGLHTIEVRGTDYAMNVGEVASTILAVYVPTPETITDSLQDIVNANPGMPLEDKVEDAIDKMLSAIDDFNNIPPDNQATVGNLEGAVGDLEAAVNEGLLDPTLAAQFMDQIAAIPQQLAMDAIDQAIAQGSDPQKISEAWQSLAEGDTFRSSGAFKDAVNKYKDALAKAESALP